MKEAGSREPKDGGHGRETAGLESWRGHAVTAVSGDSNTNSCLAGILRGLLCYSMPSA